MTHQSPIPRDDQWSTDDVRHVLVNIFHVSTGATTPHAWTKAVAKLIREEGVEITIREAVRAFNAGVESLGQFAEALDEEEQVNRFAPWSDFPPTTLATHLLNDLLPRARRWSQADK